MSFSIGHSFCCVFLFSGLLRAAPPAAPTDFVFLRSDANNAATLAWTDNATDETFFQFEIRVGDDVPFVRNGPGEDVEEFSFSGFVPGGEVFFRLRAVKPLEGGAADEFEFSDWTEEVSVITRDYNFQVIEVAVPEGVAFSSSLNADFEPEVFQINNGTLPSWLSVDETELVFSASDPMVGSFQVDFTASTGIHFRSGVATFNVANSFLSSAFTGTPGEDFTYELKADFEPDSIVINGEQPAWLSFDESERLFSAVDPPEGNYRVSFTGTSGANSQSGFVYFNVVNEAPTATGAFDALTLVEQSPVELDLSTVFEDPDFIRAAAVQTEFGDLTIGFYEGFPVTVNNFFAYALNDDWDGAFFHRMAKFTNGENFVLQGGGFKPGASEGEIARVNQLPAIVNEFDSSRPNFCGTISMAKLGGDPDSATNQFFISLNDNRAILDGQNGGFTVFGRAANIEPANRISALPRGTFQVDLEGSPIIFDDWPVTEMDATSPSFDQLTSMNDVIEIPTLSYEVSFAGDEVVTASIASALEAPLMVTPTGVSGMTLMTITASDLDGASASTTVPVTVLSSYATWAARESASGPEEMSDTGGLTNFEEYVYGGDPNDPLDDAGLMPFGGVDDSGRGFFTFRHRDFSSDLDYSVESSSNLVDWDLVWTTSDGFEDERVAMVADEGEVLEVTIESDLLTSEKSELFFRLRVASIDPE